MNRESTDRRSMNQTPVHAPLTQFAVDNDRLMIGGKSVEQLAAQVGQTPFYVYERLAMSQRVEQLRAALPSTVSVHYAIKANPMPAVVARMARMVDGLDVASLGELQVAIGSGMPAAEISFAGPGKSDTELRGAIAAGVTINLESAGELERALRSQGQIRAQSIGRGLQERAAEGRQMQQPVRHHDDAPGALDFSHCRPEEFGAELAGG